MYVTGSILGCFYKTECFSILLFNLMMQKMDVLKNILIAITTNMKMLGMLSLLGNYWIWFRNGLYIDILDLFNPLLRIVPIPAKNPQRALWVLVQLYYWAVYSGANRLRYGVFWNGKVHLRHGLHHFHGYVVWQHCRRCPDWYLCRTQAKGRLDWTR